MTILPNADFELPEYWRKWLGTIQVEEIADCTLFLLVRMASTLPDALNEEDQKLRRLIGHWYTGLTLTSKFETSDAAFLAHGYCQDGSINIRQFAPIDPPLASIVKKYRDSISVNQLRHASEIAQRLSLLTDTLSSSNWRLLRCLKLYQDARCNRDVLERIHQFTRCIEGLIAGDQGNTTRQFKSRTETFVGPHCHDLMGKLYQVRSDVEHSNENLDLEEFDREARITLAKLEALSEWIARSCLDRIILNPVLSNHFGNIFNIRRFWALSTDERREIWGSAINPDLAFADFNFQYVSNQELGASE